MKRCIVLLLVLVFLFPIISSTSIDSGIQKITYYAQEYETGNIDYVQLLIHSSAVREKLNGELGAAGKEYGGILKQAQIESALGKPNEETKWVWVEGLNYEVMLDDYIPIWKKIVFDGKKIQIKLSAYPSVFVKKNIEQEFYDKDFENEEEKQAFKNENFNKEDITRDDIIYRLHFEIEFKKPEDQLDVKGKIDDVKSLAENFNSDPSTSNAEALAKASVNTEKLFWNYFDQTQGKCEDLMTSIFGSENKRGTQELIAHQIDFFDGENFQAILRMEMCEDCEWNWINFNMWIEGRGPGFKPIKEEPNTNYESLMQQYKSFGTSEFEQKTKDLISEMKQFLEQGNYNSAMSSSQKLNILTQAWNEKANNVYEEINQQYMLEEQTMTEEQRMKLNENYGWIKREQEKRQKEDELQNSNYQARKQFYLSLFSEYDKRESSYTQVEFEKRLIEEFKEKGEEICDNNQDDNENGQIDCSDSQCGGKVCGKFAEAVIVGNQSTTQEVNYYCIAGTCQAKEEIVKPLEPVCGNHICEENETLSCVGDCALCPTYGAVNCSGKVIFSGQDETGCPLEPVCLEETEICNTDDDCADPLCGDASCIEGKCQITELTECQEPECEEGQEKIKNCEQGEEIVSGICESGIWKETNLQCPQGNTSEESEEVEEIVVSNECIYKEDCGGENDVCSNGNCVAIPEIIPVEPEETPEIPEISEETGEEEPEVETPEETEEPVEESEETPAEEPEETNEQPQEEPKQEEPQQEEPEETPPATGETVLGFLKQTATKIFGAIVGFATEDTSTDSNDAGDSGTDDSSSSDSGDTSSDTDSSSDSGDDSAIDSSQEDSSDEGTDEGSEPPTDEGMESGGEENYEENYDDSEYWEKKEKDERKRHEEEQKDRCEEECERICYDNEIRPCVEKCIWENCGNELDCNVDEETSSCESSCKSENSLDSCVDDCAPKCMEGEGWWEEFQKEPEDTWQEEKGVFQVGGGCRTSQGQTEAYLWFGGWGDPFQEIEPLKQKYYSGGQADWCKYDLENLIKKRQEFEKGFDQEFVQWFFEKYLANSAEDWEQHVSGIYELYWNNVDTLMQMSDRMNCLELDEIPMNYNLINVQYETEYGSLEYWEELKTVKMPGPDGDVQMQMITPYMKIWIFPPREFIKYELKKAMETNEFPGSPEDKLERGNQEGLTEEEKNKIRENKKFIEEIIKISDKYNGNVNAVIQFKDYEKNEVVFNLYAQINENDIMKVQPMLPEEVPEQDVLIEIDFEKLYDLIYTEEKEMRGEQIESPPWDRRKNEGGIKQVTNGIKMYFKVRDMANSAKISPESAEKDVKNLFKLFLKMMMQGEKGDGGDIENTEEKSEGISGFEDSSVSGKVIWIN